MSQLLALASCFAALELAGVDSAIGPTTMSQAQNPGSIAVLTSAYFSLGSYSTSTQSLASSAFVTMSESWRSFYTLGFQSLWLRRDDMGGRYYSQELIPARASWQLGTRLGLALHYAYLHEGAIARYSEQTVFHFVGAGGSYWLSRTSSCGTSFTLALSSGSVEASAYRAGFTTEIADGIFSTSQIVLSRAAWSPQLFSFRQALNGSLGNGSSALLQCDLGRRAFYFDDMQLIVYNQRETQTLCLGIGSAIRIYKQWYVLPSFEFDKFDPYTVSYSSIGLRAIF